MSNFVLQLSKVSKSFPQPGGAALEVLREVNLNIAAGETVALLGASGSGKTTLLQIAGLLANASSGQVHLHGREVTGLSEAERTALRVSQLGFVYQFHHLLPEFSALENVMLPMLVAGMDGATASAKAEKLLDEFGLSERAGHRPAQLSGGEMQRVAIARALANDPPLLLADEPTGNLDDASAEKVFAALMQAVKQRHMAALVVTHNRELAARLSRTVSLERGVLA